MPSDPDFQTLTDLSANMAGEYQDDGVDWTGSPFAWIQTCPSSQKGAICKKLVERWCIERGLHVSRSPGIGADRTIEGLRVRVKSSSLWADGTYTFQQLRDEDFELLVCLGISPFAAHCWAIPKSDIMSAWEDGEIRTQHMGYSGVDTAWFSADPHDPPEWLAPWGGSLSRAYEIIVQEAQAAD